MRGTITTHFVDFHSDARRAICGWTPPGDYIGVTVYLSSATCPECIEAIQQRIGAIGRRAQARDVAVTSAP